MLVNFERGMIFIKFKVAWILCSVAAVGALDVRRDSASEEKFRFKKDVASLSTEFQQILPVEVDLGSLVDTINQRISGIEGNITDLGKQLQKEASKLKQKLESSEQSKAKVEEEVSLLKMQQASMKEEASKLKQKLESSEEEVLRLSREQKSMMETISQVKEQLKSAGEQKLQTTAESIKTPSREKKFLFVDEMMKNWEASRQECIDRGGDLATHLTREDLDYIYNYVITSDNKEPSIGGHMNFAATENNFKEMFEWVDGGRVDDDLWHEYQPEHLGYKCMYIARGPEKRKDGTMGPYFGAEDCEYSIAQFLCQI